MSCLTERETNPQEHCPNFTETAGSRHAGYLARLLRGFCSVRTGRDGALEKITPSSEAPSFKAVAFHSLS